jgi:hypothetical protein
MCVLFGDKAHPKQWGEEKTRNYLEILECDQKTLCRMQEDEGSKEPAIPGTENWPCSKRNSVFKSSG